MASAGYHGPGVYNCEALTENNITSMLSSYATLLERGSDLAHDGTSTDQMPQILCYF